MNNYTITFFKYVSLASVIFFMLKCNRGKDKEQTFEPESIIYKLDTSATGNKQLPIKPPIINITDTVTIRQIVVYMKDSAHSSDRIGLKLNKIYNQTLKEVIRNNNMEQAGFKMAWFKTSSEPFFFEAGIPVNMKPQKIPKNVYVKTIGGDSAVIAHFYGPYELTYQGYGALREWMKDNKKKASGMPYEVYIGEPLDSAGKKSDPYKLKTDIIFPHH